MNEEDSKGHPKDERAYRVAYLIAGYLKETLNQQEHRELDDWVCASMDNQRLFEELTDPDNLDSWLKWKEKLPMAQALERLKNKLEFTPHRKKSRIRSLWPYVAAACILISVGIVFEWFVWNSKKDAERIVQAIPNDIAPGSNRATITLSDGKKIPLDSAKKGSLFSQSNILILKDDSGLVTYKMVDALQVPGKEEYNILTTPPGGQFRIQLSDGTNVWLNASSSLKYPMVFRGDKRKVELAGQGYFEVAKDAAHPFIVSDGDNEIQVIGTHFDVNGYTDSRSMTVTLAEGSIKLNGKLILKPGQQASVNQAGDIQTAPADLETALAWKNGQFIFKETSIDQVMFQVTHWYNARIVYQNNISEHFNARIPRDVPVSKLLHLLEATGRVHFKIEDKTITVMN